MYKLGDKSLESSLMEKQEGVWTDGKLNMTHHCPASQEGNWSVLGCLRHSITSWAREMIVPLCAGAASPQVLCAALGAQLKERVQREVTKGVQDLQRDL